MGPCDDALGYVKTMHSEKRICDSDDSWKESLLEKSECRGKDIKKFCKQWKRQNKLLQMTASSTLTPCDDALGYVKTMHSEKRICDSDDSWKESLLEKSECKG